MMLENHQKERERARLEREALLGQRSTCVDGHHHGQQHGHYLPNHQINHHEAGCHGMPQSQQAPPMHPQYGPAVFDYNYGCWTYPYAQWYAGNHDYQQYSGDEEEERADTKVPSPPERHDVEISIQKDFDFNPKPEVNIMATQTATEAKAVTSDFAIQTQTMHVSETGTSPLKTQSQKWKSSKDENSRLAGS
jgi:hypothetical protein